MKKLLTCVAILMFSLGLTSCDDIREIVNDVENMIIEESLNALANEIGVEDFVLPEYEDIDIEFEYDQEQDVSKLELEIEQPNIELDEYKDQLVSYVEDALSEYVEVDELVGFEPTKTETGYVWNYSYEETQEDGTIKEVVINVELLEDEGDFLLNLKLENLGDIFSSIEKEIEEGTEENNA